MKTTLRFDHVLIPPGETLPCVSHPVDHGSHKGFRPLRLNVICMNLTQTGQEPPGAVDVEQVFYGEAEPQNFDPASGADYSPDKSDTDAIPLEMDLLPTRATMTIWAANTTSRMIRFLPVVLGIYE